MTDSNTKFEKYSIDVEKLPKGKLKVDLTNEYAWELSRIKTQDAQTIALEALSLATELDYVKGIAEAERTISQCAWLQGDYTSAISHCVLAEELFIELDDLTGQSEVLNLFGGIYSKMSDQGNALKYFTKALDLRKQTGDKLGIAKSLNSLGDVRMKAKNYPEALKIFQECLLIEHDNLMFKGIILYNLAETNFYLNNIEDSLNQIKKCQKIGEELDFDLMKVYSLTIIGKISIEKGDLQKGIKDLNEALAIAIKINSLDRVFYLHKLLSKAYEKEGDLSQALTSYKKYQEVKEELLNEESAQKIKSVEYRSEMAQIQKESEIERKKNVELQDAFDKIENQRNEIKLQNTEIISSIKYAERIQSAILPSDAFFKSHLPDSFVFFRPKDVLSGDFYWISSAINDIKESLILTAVADCTGHGVPGALMSIVGNNFLRLCEHEATVNNPADALNFVNHGLANTLRQTDIESSIKDGMDMAFLAIDYPNMKFYFAGAKNPIYIVRNGELREIKGDRHPIGAFVGEELLKFTNHSVPMEKDDCLYLFSDGYADQFGGETQKKLKYKNFKNLILEHVHLPMTEQLKHMETFFDSWKGDLEQLDDVCVMGIRI
ncbi:MAG: serine phosphatase RsbU (regulator of sigma subunit) [Arenicella sp.]|jgi:serine phosphatase RsbU (regulator of sigma subunit)